MWRPAGVTSLLLVALSLLYPVHSQESDFEDLLLRRILFARHPQPSKDTLAELESVSLVQVAYQSASTPNYFMDMRWQALLKDPHLRRRLSDLLHYKDGRVNATAVEEARRGPLKQEVDKILEDKAATAPESAAAPANGKRADHARAAPPSHKSHKDDGKRPEEPTQEPPDSRPQLDEAEAAKKALAEAEADKQAAAEAVQKAEADARAEAQKRAEVEAEIEQQKREAEATRRAKFAADEEAHRRALEEAEASRKKGEAEAKAAAEAKARAEAVAAKEKAEEEALAAQKKAEAEASARAAAEAAVRKAEADAEAARQRAEAEAKAEAAAQAKATEAEAARKKAEAAAEIARQQAEEAWRTVIAEARAEQKARADAEAARKAQAEAEAKAKDQAAARARDEAMAKQAEASVPATQGASAAAEKAEEEERPETPKPLAMPMPMTQIDAGSAVDQAEREAAQEERARRLAEETKVKQAKQAVAEADTQEVWNIAEHWEQGRVCMRPEDLEQALEDSKNAVIQGLPMWREAEIPTKVEDITLAFLIQASWEEQLRVLRRTFDLLYTPHDLFLYTVDRERMETERVTAILPNPLPPNVVVKQSAHSAYYVWPRVEIVLDGLRTLLMQQKKWDFAIHLSESDFPLHSVGWIRRSLAMQRGTNFIQLMPRCQKNSLTGPNTDMVKDDWYWWTQDDALASCGSDTDVTTVDGVKFPQDQLESKGFRFAHGAEWMAVTRELVKYALSPDLLPYRKMIGMHVGADEIFWQTLVLNIPGFKQNVSQQGWYIKWGHGKTDHSPDTLTRDYEEDILKNREKYFFMRKVSEESMSLLDDIAKLDDSTDTVPGPVPQESWLEWDRRTISCDGTVHQDITQQADGDDSKARGWQGTKSRKQLLEVYKWYMQSQ